MNTRPTTRPGLTVAQLLTTVCLLAGGLALGAGLLVPALTTTYEAQRESHEATRSHHVNNAQRAFASVSFSHAKLEANEKAIVLRAGESVVQQFVVMQWTSAGAYARVRARCVHNALDRTMEGSEMCLTVEQRGTDAGSQGVSVAYFEDQADRGTKWPSVRAQKNDGVIRIGQQ